MNISKHAVIRGKQRGIPQVQVDMIVEFGTPFRRPGNAIEYVMTKKDVEKAVKYFKGRIQELEKAGQKAVLIDPDADEVITVYIKN